MNEISKACVVLVLIALPVACNPTRESVPSVEAGAHTSIPDSTVNGCGDGIVRAPEECDPAAPGWTPATCSTSCRPSIYTPCVTSRDCPAGQTCPLLFGGACTVHCDENTPCPTLPNANAPACKRNTCLIPCTSTGDCPPELSCRHFDRMSVRGVLMLEHSVCASDQTGSPLTATSE
jgi:hypothetical protein